MAQLVSEPTALLITLGCSLLALWTLLWGPTRRALLTLPSSGATLGRGVLFVGATLVFGATAALFGTGAQVGDQSSVYADVGRLGVACYWLGLHVAAAPAVETLTRIEFPTAGDGTLAAFEAIDDRFRAWVALLEGHYGAVNWGALGFPVVAVSAPILGVSLGVTGGLLLYGVCVAWSTLYDTTLDEPVAAAVDEAARGRQGSSPPPTE
ncbi:hypothetical protein RYH80_05945 [Halobaculum sp. MBLA0147]|uniref:hypothetical protein n=1 Tax=Halobaculum sp. MBLA0147 TaxID=3079934 RepID=UPI0035252CB3